MKLTFASHIGQEKLKYYIFHYIPQLFNGLLICILQVSQLILLNESFETSSSPGKKWPELLKNANIVQESAVKLIAAASKLSDREKDEVNILFR